MKSVPIPKHLENRPRYKGLPIPYVALIKPDGDPDFRVIDEYNRRDVVLNRKCQLCSEALGKYIFFVGGTEAAKGNQYFEPATHLECLVYAMQVCPFILGRVEHADPDKIQSQLSKQDESIQVHVSPAYTVVKNPYWVIKKATSYNLLVLNEKDVLIVPTGVVWQTPPLHAESMTEQDWKDVEYQLRTNEGKEGQ